MDKLTVLNNALGASGNALMTVLNDGTPRWIVSNQAYERAIVDLASRHNWPFAQVSHALTPADDNDNPSRRYGTAYLLPATMIHVKAVLVGGIPVTAYEIVGAYLCIDDDSGVAVEGYAMPAGAIWHPQAAEIVTMYVEAGCLRGLNKDRSEADKREQAAEFRLLEARPRVSRQNPAKDTYVSSIGTARRSRMGG